MKAFYIEVLKLDLNSDTAEAILETLEASFNCPTKMNEVRSAFFKETKHFSETSWKFFRDTPSDSVPQTVLNALFENLFGDLAAGEDVFRHGRDNAEAKAELEAIFSEANLDEQKEVLREVLETEIAKLMTDKIFPALMRLFESGKKGTKKIMNIVKQAYRDVEGSTKVGDQQGAAKAEKFRQLCQRTATTCDKLAELEASPGLQETMLVKCIRAKSKLDRFMADPDTKLTSTEDMQLLKRYGEKLPRQGYPVEDQEHWLTWEAVSDAVGSLELTLNSGEPQPPPPQAVLEKGLPLGLFNHLQNQRAILVPASPLSADDQSDGICGVLSDLVIQSVDVDASAGDDGAAGVILAQFTDLMRLKMGVRATMEPHHENVPANEAARHEVKAFLETFADVFKASVELYFVRAGKGWLIGGRRPKVIRLVWDQYAKMLYLVNPVVREVGHRTPGYEVSGTNRLVYGDHGHATVVDGSVPKVVVYPPGHGNYFSHKRDECLNWRDIRKHSVSRDNVNARLKKSSAAGDMTRQPRGQHQAAGIEARDNPDARDTPGGTGRRRQLSPGPRSASFVSPPAAPRDGGNTRKRGRPTQPHPGHRSASSSPPAAQRARGNTRRRSQSPSSRSASPAEPTDEMLGILNAARGPGNLAHLRLRWSAYCLRYCQAHFTLT